MCVRRLLSLALLPKACPSFYCIGDPRNSGDTRRDSQAILNLIAIRMAASTPNKPASHERNPPRSMKPRGASRGIIDVLSPRRVRAPRFELHCGLPGHLLHRQRPRFSLHRLPGVARLRSTTYCGSAPVRCRSEYKTITSRLRRRIIASARCTSLSSTEAHWSPFDAVVR